MPIIIEGGSRSAGWWWARHLENIEKNERAQLIAIDGLSNETVPELFREMHAMSLGSARTKNYFYQANINPRADERLTPKQRDEAIATLGRNLGLEGQPHFVVEHEKAGRTHWHVVWLRVDLERMRAIPDSLTARIHEQTSRELEIKFGLEPGRSILVADRDFERPERRAKKYERFRGAQNGIDPHSVANELRAIRERSDNGRSFRAGIEAAGYVLAHGDRRDFLVIDRAGKEHALSRGLGMKAAELRRFMQGIDARSLPRVAEAKAQQRVRAAEQKQERAGQATAPQQPRRAEAKHGRAGQGQETAQPEKPRRKVRQETHQIDIVEQATKDHNLRSPGAIATSAADGIAKGIGAAMNAIADMIAPPPPLTEEQAELKERADKEARERAAVAREEAEYQKRLHALLDQQKRRNERDRREREDARARRSRSDDLERDR